MDNMTFISRLVEDIGCLEPVTKAVSKVNLFEILSVSRTEIRHSNMLAWLMNPHGSHGLGGRVLRGIVSQAAGGLPLNYEAFSIRREENYIDIMAVSEKDRYVLCIENKTYSGEHDNQLDRYRNYVGTTFPGYTAQLIYLTRKGREASDPENWRTMSYGDILNIIEEARKDVQLQPEVILILDNYTDVIRGFGGGDDRIRNLCSEVYRKHQRALDLFFSINEKDAGDDSVPAEEQRICRELCWKYRKELAKINQYRPKKKEDPVTEAIRAWADAMAQEDRIFTSEETRSRSYERFTTPVMSGLLPDAIGCRSGWNTENFYFYEIYHRELPSHDWQIKLQLCTNLKDIPEDLKRVSDRISRVKPPLHESASHRINFETEFAMIRQNEGEDAVWSILDGFLSRAKQFEQELTAGLEQ